MILTGCGLYPDIPAHPRGWSSPPVTALDQYGRRIDLRQATSGAWAVVFFYPKADTPG
jgi:peroxiredoxin